MENFKDDLGIEIDALIRQRINAFNQMNQAEKALLKHGVKFGFQPSEGLPEYMVGANYLPQFEQTLEEYEWEVTYTDGRILRQYELRKQHHYGDIEHDKIKEVRYLSNFYGENDNQDRRVILTLDWETGMFDILNAQMDPEDRATLLAAGQRKEKKLILFKRVRFGQTMKIGKEVNPTPEIFIYKRYFLGYESPEGKIIIGLLPNGQAVVI